MAKHRKGGHKTKHRKGGNSPMTRAHRKGSHRKSRNAPAFLSKLSGGSFGPFRLPTGAQTLGAGGAAIALPAASKIASNFLPAVGGGWGGVLLEFGLGSLAAGLTRKMSPGASEGILLFTVGRSIGRAASLATNGFIGLSEDSENPGLHAYIDSKMAAFVQGGELREERRGLEDRSEEQSAPVFGRGFAKVI